MIDLLINISMIVIIGLLLYLGAKLAEKLELTPFELLMCAISGLVIGTIICALVTIM